MTSTNDRPYTDADLRTEAARQHATLLEDPDFVGVGERMQDSEVASLAPQHTAEDIDGQPNDADGVTWSQLLPPEADDCEAYDLAQNRIYDLIQGAADVSDWAVDLGADGLEPDGEVVDIAHGDVIGVRIHFAFHPDMPAELRASVIAAVHEETAAPAGAEGAQR